MITSRVKLYNMDCMKGLEHLQSGNLVTGWFFWNRNWKSKYWETSIMDVQNGVVNKKDIDKIK